MKKLIILTSLSLILMIFYSVNSSAQIAGNALQLDGLNDYVLLNRPIEDDFTIEFWFKTADNGGRGTQWYQGSGLIDGEVGGVTNDFGTSICNGRVFFGTGRPDITIKSDFVADGTWHHAASTRNKINGLLNLFIDGSLRSEGRGAKSSLTRPKYIRIGSLQTNIKFFKGVIDEVRIWNRALTEDEIIANMNRELTGSEPGLVVYYNFNEFTPDGQIKDLSPYGNHGTIHGGAILIASDVPIELSASPESMKESLETLISNIESKIDQLKKEKINTSSLKDALNEVKNAANNEDYKLAFEKVREAMAKSAAIWSAFQQYNAVKKEIDIKLEQLKKNNVSMSIIEEAVSESQNAFEKENFELAQQLINDASKKADQTWKTYQSIEGVEKFIKMIDEIGCDASEAKDKIKEAIDALNKGSYTKADEYVAIAAQLAEKANCGKIKIQELKALAVKFDGKTVEISGEVRDLKTEYGRGYKFAVDDGSALIEVVYEGSMKDVEQGDKVFVKGSFFKRGDRIKAEIVEKSGGSLLIYLFIVIVIIIVGVAFYYMKLQKKEKKP